MKNFLFPRGFQCAGWLLFIPAVIMGVLCYFSLCSVSGIVETILNDAIIIGIASGAIFIVCSKEPCEDEMTHSIRLSSLLNALYAYIALLIVSTLVINGVDFFSFMIVNLVLFPIIYVVIFRLEMRRYNKMSGDEE